MDYDLIQTLTYIQNMKEQKEQPENFIIPAELLQNIMDYLLNQRMIDVMQLVNGIQTSVKPYEVEKELTSDELEDKMKKMSK